MVDQVSRRQTPGPHLHTRPGLRPWPCWCQLAGAHGHNVCIRVGGLPASQDGPVSGYLVREEVALPLQEVEEAPPCPGWNWGSHGGRVRPPDAYTCDLKGWISLFGGSFLATGQ